MKIPAESNPGYGGSGGSGFPIAPYGINPAEQLEIDLRIILILCNHRFRYWPFPGGPCLVLKTMVFSGLSRGSVSYGLVSKITGI